MRKIFFLIGLAIVSAIIYLSALSKAVDVKLSDTERGIASASIYVFVGIILLIIYSIIIKIMEKIKEKRDAREYG